MIEVYLKTNTNYEMNGDMPLEPSNCSYKSRIPSNNRASIR